MPCTSKRSISVPHTRVDERGVERPRLIILVHRILKPLKWRARTSATSAVLLILWIQKHVRQREDLSMITWPALFRARTGTHISWLRVRGPVPTLKGEDAGGAKREEDKKSPFPCKENTSHSQSQTHRVHSLYSDNTRSVDKLCGVTLWLCF